MAANDSQKYIVESDSDDEIKSVGPEAEDSDDELIVEDNDFTVDNGQLGYDMKVHHSVSSEIEKRNKQMHNKHKQSEPAELADSSDDDNLKDSDAEKMSDDEDSDFSEEGLELISDMPKPDKSGKVVLVVDGGNSEDAGEEMNNDSDNENEKAGSDCEEKCSDDESNDEWLEGNGKGDDDEEAEDEECDEEECKDSDKEMEIENGEDEDDEKDA